MIRGFLRPTKSTRDAPFCPVKDEDILTVASNSDPSRWWRRAVTVPAVLLGTAAFWTLLPVLLPLALLVDAVRRVRLATTRTLVMTGALLVCEAAGVSLAFAAWFASGTWGGADPVRFTAWNNRLQHWWTGTLWRTLVRLFALQVEVRCDEPLVPGPLLMMVRHASSADTLLPMALVAVPHHLDTRYALKAELLWDPCLDIVGNRLPNAFLDRSGADTEAQVAKVAALAEGLGPRDLVVIYPEGTRFSPAGRQRRLARLQAEGDEDGARRLASFHHVLPPRPGGTLALLDTAPGTDVLFCAHTGFEQATRMGHLLAGGLVGQRVQVRLWRVAAAQVPAGAEARRAWLEHWWHALDRWIGERTPTSPPLAGAPPPD